MPIAGKRGHERPEHARRRVFGKEQVAELGGIEAENESPERKVAPSLAARVAGEAARRQIASVEASRHGLGGFEAGLESDRNAELNRKVGVKRISLATLRQLERRLEAARAMRKGR